MAEDAFDKELAANRANWDARAAVHAGSAFYDLEHYADDPQAISTIVEWDRRLLGNVEGLDLLHLQCHIGTDTISWARLGANVTGLDFSSESLRVAKDLASRAGAGVEFVYGDVRQADQVLGRQFDLVYTSVGVLCWLPDIREWAKAASACLRPGGRLYLRDGHPLLATFDYDRDDSLVVCKGDYYGDGSPQRFDDGYTYTGDLTRLTSPVAYEWTHGLGAILTALAEQDLRIHRVEEYDWLDWKLFPWMIEEPGGRWRFPPGHPRLPLAFSILAARPIDARASAKID